MIICVIIIIWKIVNDQPRNGGIFEMMEQWKEEKRKKKISSTLYFKYFCWQSKLFIVSNRNYEFYSLLQKKTEIKYNNKKIRIRWIGKGFKSVNAENFVKSGEIVNIE